MICRISARGIAGVCTAPFAAPKRSPEKPDFFSFLAKKLWERAQINYKENVQTTFRKIRLFKAKTLRVFFE